MLLHSLWDKYPANPQWLICWYAIKERLKEKIAQSAGAVEYTDYFSAEG